MILIAENAFNLGRAANRLVRPPFISASYTTSPPPLRGFGIRADAGLT
jgi:hypothetical protein